MPKISELPLANKLKEEDYIPIVQDGVTKKVKGTHFVTEEEYSLDAFSPTITANDKAMYKFGEGDNVDFSDSAYDGAYKSAILKGNTLVNIAPSYVIDYTATANWDGFHVLMQPSNPNGRTWIALQDVKPNTKYFISCYVETFDVDDNEYYLINNRNDQTVFSDSFQVDGVGLYKWIATSKSEFTDNTFFVLRCQNGHARGAIKIKDFMVIEYQEGMENWDIPYFEGMQSVKMPVLKTTGKNILNENICEWEQGSIGGINGELSNANNRIRTKEFIPIQNAKFVTQTLGKMALRFYDVNKNFIYSATFNGFIKSGDVFSVPSNAYYLKTVVAKNSDELIVPNDITSMKSMIEYNTVMSDYEPHKSNILSCNEPVELRGIGDVRDTLDLTKSEDNLVEAIGEVVLDGSEDERIGIVSEFDNVIRFTIKSVVGKTSGKVASDKFTYADNNLDTEHIRLDASSPNGILQMYISKNRLPSANVDGFKEYLRLNPVTIQYQLNEKAIKTVDLSGTPFGYKGGHIIKSSAEGSLLPKFEYEVAVSRGAQISQNTSTLIKHDEKITELLRKTAATYINQKAEIAHLLNMSNTLEEVQTIPFIEDDYVDDDCMVDSDMVMDDMELEPEKEIIDNVDTLLINLIYDLIELNDTLDLSEKVELFRQSGLIDKHNYEIIKEKLNPSFKEEDYADINQ